MSQTKVWTSTKATVVRLTDAGGSVQGCGQAREFRVGRHGSSGSRNYRSYIYFTPDWSGVGVLHSAILTVFTDAPAGATPEVIVERLTSAFVEGNNADGVYDATDATSPHMTTSGKVVKVPMAKITDISTDIDLTAMVRAWAPASVVGGGKAPNYGIALVGTTNAANYWTGYSEDATDGTKHPILTLTYDPGPTTPNTPSIVSPSGAVATIGTFKADFSDPRPTDTLAVSQVQVFRAATPKNGTAATNDVISVTAHGFNNGQVVWFASVTGGAPLSTAQPYYVRDRTNDTFKVATAPGGAAVNITTVASALSVDSAIYDRTQSASNAEIVAAQSSVEPDGLQVPISTNFWWRIRQRDQESRWSAWTGRQVFSISDTPPNPPSPQPAAGTFATMAGILFRGGTFTDPDGGDTLGAYQVQLSAYPSGDSHWDDPTFWLWDTGRVNALSGDTSWSIPYGGRSLTAGTYYWRARQFDNHGAASSWAYTSLILTTDFTTTPGTQTDVQVKPEQPYRIVIRDMVDQTPPSIALVQSKHVVGGAGAGFAFVQAASDTDDASVYGQATFSSAPTPGNLLVAVAMLVQGSVWTNAVPIWPAGWVNDLPNPGWGGDPTDFRIRGIFQAHKIADGTETGPIGCQVSIDSQAPGPAMTVIAEYSGPTNGITVVDTTLGGPRSVGVATDPLPALTPTAGENALLIYAHGHEPQYQITSASSGIVKRDDVFITPSRQRISLVDHIITSASGTYTGTVTTDSGGDGNAWATGVAYVGGATDALNSTPTVGNLLLAWQVAHSTAVPPLPAGFTNIALVRVSVTGTQRWGRMSYRYVQAGDTGDGIPPGIDSTMMEWRAAYAGRFIAATSHVATTAFRAGGNITPTAHVPMALVGGGVISNANSPSISVTPLSGTTELVDSMPSAPDTWVGYKIVNNPSGAYNVGGTLNHSVKYGGVTVALTQHTPNRGPNKIVAILDDAKGTGASIVHNSPGELHFILPIDHPQGPYIEPKRTHYSVQFYDGDGWREKFAGLIDDVDSTETDTVYLGVDYLGLLRYTADERYDVNSPKKPYNKGGEFYPPGTTIRTVIIDQLQQAIGHPNSPVNFIKIGQIDAMNEQVSLHSAYQQTLPFIASLIESHRGGTQNRTRIYVHHNADDTFEFRVINDPGRVRDNLRLRYGELVSGFRIILFGTAWASAVAAIGRPTDGFAVWKKFATAPGINPAVFGRIVQVNYLQDIHDQNDLQRRANQLALHASKIGKQLGLGIRTDIMQPLDGYDITDYLPVDINYGIINTSTYGSGYYAVMGVQWSVGEEDNQDTTITFLPREDTTAPDTDLLQSLPIQPQREWTMGYVAPDPLVVHSDFYVDLTTGITYQRFDDGDSSDDFDPQAGTIVTEGPDQVDP